MANCLAITKAVWRFVEAVFAIAAFGTAAYLLDYGWSSSRLGFMVFVGVTYFLICIAYILAVFVEGLQGLLYGLVELVLSGLYFIFWMAAAGALAGTSLASACRDKALQRVLNDVACDNFLGSMAMGWILWISTIAHLIVAGLDVKRGRGLGGGSGAPVSYPTSA